MAQKARGPSNAGRFGFDWRAKCVRARSSRVAEPAIQRFGKKSRGQIAKERRDHDNRAKQDRNCAEWFARMYEKPEAGEHHEHVGQIHFIATLAEIQKRPE